MAHELMTRRSLVGAGAGILVLEPALVRGTAANSALRLGILGCGSRARAVAGAFIESTNTRVVVLADLFSDQLEAAKKHYDGLMAAKGHAGVDRGLMMQGPEAYRRFAESKEFDIALIATPDYFHPQHLAACVAAGKHVYCEKPVAVDVAGCQRIIEIGKQAEGRLSLDVGFEVRYAVPFAEIVRRVQAGDIGKVGLVSAYYHAPELRYPARPNASPLEFRVRNFYWDRVLSGDVIVDQNIHVLDICNWALGAHPDRAIGTGGRRIRNDAGNVWDHFSVSLSYPDGAQVSFNSVQFGDSFWDVGCRFLGAQGMAECYYSGKARVTGPRAWQVAGPPDAGGFSAAGAFLGLAGSEGAKVTKFVESIKTGKFHNEAATGAEAALTAILARTAAYSGRETTWAEMIRSNQSYEGAIDIRGLG